MKVASLAKVRDNLSRYVDAVRRGERVRILVRGIAAADLVPVGADAASGDEDALNLDDLERRGLIRRPKNTGQPDEILNQAGPRARGKPLSEMIIEERRNSSR